MDPMLSPQETAICTVELGVYKTSKKLMPLFISAIMAGMFIALGYTGYLIIAGILGGTGSAKVVGGIAFPVGLTMVLVSGTDLFTSNCLIIMAWFKREISGNTVIKNLGTVWVGNLIGSLFFVLLVYLSGLLMPEDIWLYTVHLAEKKAHLDFMTAFSRGILCNFLVAGTAYMSYSAKSVAGKAIFAFVPLWMFVITGFEHSVANMFAIPMGAALTRDSISVGSIVTNLIPVTLGNMVGGVLIAAVFYYLTFHKKKSY